MGTPIERHLTRDGGLVHRGPEYYLLARMAEPGEKVHVVEWEPTGRSMIDGQPVTRYLVRNARGTEFLVEPWQLSRVPADELYRQLRNRHYPPTRVPVSPVRFAPDQRVA